MHSTRTHPVQQKDNQPNFLHERRLFADEENKEKIKKLDGHVLYALLLSFHKIPHVVTAFPTDLSIFAAFWTT